MIASVDTQRSAAASTGAPRKHNGCLSALSPAALSILKPHLAEPTLSEGAILWDAKRPTPMCIFLFRG
jgi:hypothetical protein